MKELPVNLDRLKKEDVFSVASALLYSLKDSPQYSTISELFYILDYDNFIKLIKYYGGTTIRVPSSEEISQTLKLLLLYQYREVENLSWEESLKKSDISQEESRSCRTKLNHLKSILNLQEIGGRSYD